MAQVGVIGHGPMGESVARALRLSGRAVAHLSHSQQPGSEVDVLFLCAPARYVPEVLVGALAKYTGLVVDCAGQCPDPQVVEGLSTKRYVKALGDVGAVDLLQENARGTNMCGTSRADCEKAGTLIRAMGMTPVVLGNLRALPVVDAWTRRWCPGWPTTLCITAVFWVTLMVYALSRYLDSWCCGKYDNSRIAMYLFNKVNCWTGIWLLALTYLFGGVAKLWPAPLPNSMIGLLNIRKHVGLMGVMMVVAHILTSTLLFNKSYYGKFFKPDGTLFLWAEWSMFLGVVGACLLIPISVTSFVGTYTFNEWRTAQFYLGMLVLGFSASHVVIMGNPAGKKGWGAIGDSTVHEGMPSITFMFSVPVLAVVALRLFTEAVPQWWLPKRTAWDMDVIGLCSKTVRRTVDMCFDDEAGHGSKELERVV